MKASFALIFCIFRVNIKINLLFLTLSYSANNIDCKEWPKEVSGNKESVISNKDDAFKVISAVIIIIAINLFSISQGG